MSFNYKSDDGTAKLSKVTVLNDAKTLSLGTPHQGSSCSFKIFSFKNISTGQTQAEQNIPLAQSHYCSPPESEPTFVTATIGVTSVSELDRLLDVCLTRLHVGESAEVEINCHRSKSSSTLLIELVSLDESTELYDLTIEKILEISTLLKDQGVKLFADGFVIDAFCKFSQAMKYLCLLPPPSAEQHASFISTLQNNMSSCHVKVNNWDDVIDLCTSVLETDSSNMKALYRRGCSYIEIQEYELASKDLNKAISLDPENKAVKIKLQVLGDKEKALNTKYAQAMKKFFA